MIECIKNVIGIKKKNTFHNNERKIPLKRKNIFGLAYCSRTNNQ